MKNTVYTLLSVCIFLFYSCYEDKGNYDYGDINEVKIIGLPDKMETRFKNADTLKIEPTVENTISGGNAGYEYTWTAVKPDGSGENDQPVVIGREKNLNYFIELPIGRYYIYLNVLDKDTGVSWRGHFDLNVITATTSGWLVLCDNEGNTRLDMISQAGDNEFMLRDILKNYNMPNKKGPDKILQTLNYNASGIKDKIILITRTGTCYLDPEELSWEEAFEYKYEMGKMPEIFLPTHVASITPKDWSYSRNILLTTTEVYCKQLNSGSIYELPKNNLAGEEGTFKVAPFAITSGEDYETQRQPPVVLYDTDNKRFVQLDLNWDGTSCRVPTVKNEVFQMVTGKDFVYASNTRQNSDSSFIILKANDNKLWLHGLSDLNTNSFKQLENYYYQLEAPNIERAKLFAVHTYYYFLFYVVDNRIYQFDMVSKENRELKAVDKEGKEINFAGEEITFIKFNPLQYGNHKDAEGYGQNEYRLIVGSSKGGENGGIIRMINIKERINEKATLHEEYTGFGKPVDIVLKERK